MSNPGDIAGLVFLFALIAACIIVGWSIADEIELR